MKKSPTRFIRRVDNKFTSASLDLNFQNMTTSGFDSRITFTRASSGTYFDGSGILQTASTNVPRLDHSPTTLQSLGLLIEEQRTNLLTYSEDFANAAWTKSEATITSNTIIAPDGMLTGDKLVDNSNNALHFTLRAISVTANTNYAYTVFVKKGEFSNIRIRYGKSLTPFTRIGIIYNFDTGVITNSDVGTPTSATVRSATPVGNGWVRLCVAGIFDTTSTDGHVEVTLVDNSGNAVFTGNGVNGTYVWGAQLEAGAFPTSYIPTGVATATRNADVATMTGTNFSSWYNATEGTIYSESSVLSPSGTQKIVQADASAGFANSIDWYYASSGFPRFDGFVNSASQWALTPAGGAVTANTVTKLAGVYKVNDIAAVRNAGTVLTDTSALIPSVNRLLIGNANLVTQFLNGHIRRIAYYPVRLSNDQLQALTR